MHQYLCCSCAGRTFRLARQPRGSYISSAGAVASTVGVSVGLHQGRYIKATGDTATVSGAAAQIAATRVLAAGVGSILVVGNSQSRRFLFSIGGKNFSHSGQSVILRRGLYLGAGKGTFTQTGRPTRFVRTHIVGHGSGGFIAVPRAVSLSYQTRLKLIRVNYFTIGRPLNFRISSFVGDGPEVMIVSPEVNEVIVPGYRRAANAA